TLKTTCPTFQMSRWREKGFVQDTDEEDELDHSTSSPSPPRQNAHQVQPQHNLATSPGLDGHNEPLQVTVCEADELQQDLTLVKPAQRKSTPDKNEGLPQHNTSDAGRQLPFSEDFSSSSLGALTSSESESDENQRGLMQRYGTFRVQDTSADVVQVVVTKIPLNVSMRSPSTAKGEQIQQRSRRTLRRRNPIQLHPYLLEGERYRQTLKSRGIKPVHIGADLPSHSLALEAVETQEQEFDPEDETQPINPTETVHVDSALLKENMGTNAAPPLHLSFDEDEELPDVDAILRCKVDVVQQSYKRRKTIHDFDATRKHYGEYGRNETSLLSHGKRLRLTNSGIYDVPPSPHLRSPIRYAIRNGFRMPKDTSPIRLPTPIVSSDTSPLQHAIARESDSDTPPRSTLRQRTHISRTTSIMVQSSSDSDPSDSDTSDSQSNGSESSQLKQVERKIKGVLPASWLKLDRQDQLKRRPPAKAQKPRNISPDRLESHRGVAQRVIRSSKNNNTLSPEPEPVDGSLETSDESDRLLNSRVVDESPSSPYSLSRNVVSFPNLTGSTGVLDVIEDNRVDLMLPSTSRAKTTNSRSQKRQSKLTDVFDVPRKHLKGTSGIPSNHTPTFRPRPPGGTGDSKIITPKPRPPKLHSPRLSILDSHQMRSEVNDSIPQFIRLAARQARRQPEDGRHSPKTKYIRLHTHTDTEDANRTLREWTAGSLLPSLKPRKLINMKKKHWPLIDRPDNQQQPHPQYRQRSLPPPTRKRFSTVSVRKPVSSETTRNKVCGSPNFQQLSLDSMPVQRNSYEPISGPTGTGNHSPSLHKLVQARALKNIPAYRTAQLEGLETEFDMQHQKSAFQKKLCQADRQFLDQLSHAKSMGNPQLTRYLADDDHDDAAAILPPQLGVDSLAYDTVKQQQRAPVISRTVHIPRKGPVRRLDVEAREFRQPSEPPPEEVFHQTLEVTHSSKNVPALFGLSSFGTRFSINFDVFPLEAGTFFHQSTFIGSGDLSSCLHVTQRDLDIPAGHSIIPYNGKGLHCSSWTEETSSELTAIVHAFCRRVDISPNLGLTSEPENLVKYALSKTSVFLRSIIKYLSTSLSFLDPVDRRPFITKMLELVDHLFITTLSTTTVTWSDANLAQEIDRRSTRILTYILAISGQLVQIARHPSCELVVGPEAELLVKKVSKALLKILLQKGCPELRVFLDENRRHQEREAGIDAEKCYVECLVVTLHVLDRLNIPGSVFWDVINGELSTEVAKINQIAAFERIWYSAFVFLPFVEFDSSGALQVGRRFTTSNENWGFVKSMINRLFSFCPESSRGNNSSLNAYIRAMLTRCHNLIRNWGWRKCETLLGGVFDFFARNGLAQLRHEESRGSPRFLELLGEYPSLEVQPEDRAFHIFLKSLALGLRGMRNVYSDKKIRGIAWRFIPNHGRIYRKDECIRQEDLDALRNHHDVLCTLYWASPSEFRPRVDLLRGLVDHSSSHREACRLNVRAWANLVRFQLSTDEPYSSLQPFSLWYKEIVEQTIMQYRLARTEAESHYEAANSVGDSDISPEVLRATIKNNQNQVLATLRDALAGMKNAVNCAKDENLATRLLKDSAATDVFALFEAKNSNLNTVISDALEIFKVYAGLQIQLRKQVISQQTNEESQDYGEWPDFDDGFGAETQTNRTHCFDFVQKPLWHLLSNLFGAEISPPEFVLTQAVDTWVMTIQWLVQSRRRSWGDYVGSYGPISWHQLRDTEQTRKFAAYFMSSAIENDRNIYEEHQQDFISAWLSSLVERESTLKFQHRFTTILINTDPQNQLLRNLPFLVDSKTGCVSITASTFRERRLSLISSILSNMRGSYEEVMRDRPQDLGSTRRELISLLKALMSAMKKNYQELQQASIVKGAYVEFVQKVVEFLQQYTSDLCAVDKFFTDSVAFPLPATDPTYVVGRLRSYALKLGDSRTTKQLSIFIQTVSERAAVDNLQSYLVSQLHEAMSATYEAGDITTPTLRRVLLQTIFPAYIEVSFRTPAGWIVAKPILQASSQMFNDLFYNFSITDSTSVKASLAIIISTFQILCRVTKSLVDHSGLLEQPHVLHTLTLVFQTVTAMLPLLDYIQARTQQANSVLPFIAYFKELSTFVTETIASFEASLAPYFDEEAIPVAMVFDNIREFCTNELNQAMQTNWAKVEDQYFVVRGNMRKEVIVNIGTVEEEQCKTLSAIEGFYEVYRRFGSLGTEKQERRRQRDFQIETLLI
ncbi:uncharacterized protein K441DRAFT_587741, partial [Cenococcum geophilum 1.58]|uniref:uncharacterized protein n=1 Tax=Cenococcum geophilum 1.58 TaxID=794803 RepID=UPI00358FBE0A